MATNTARREPYIGEKRNFKREGYGVYVYENQYFRYEGEWKNGKKHGHGKLLMKDGTYYEGQFVNGEINGHGFKYFSFSHCKYTGQFLDGEMHGYGVMQYKDGSIYEGHWHKNKKQGFGVLRTSSKAVYEGTFSGHQRNGEGSQTYEGKHKLSNGDRYEGYWVMDKRHGHGELYCADFSYYVGQFAEDMFHGEGKMQHASGMLYFGQWLHGFPSRLATKLKLIVEESPLVIRQGQPFKIAVKCLDDEDNEVEEDQGREIQVMAGFKYIPPKQGSVLFDMIEDVEEKPIPTPFGYEVVSYPLTDQLSEEEVTAEDDKGEKSARDDDGEGEGGDIAEAGEGEEEGGKEVTGLSMEDGTATDLMQPPEPAASPSQDPANTELATEGTGNPCAITPVETTPLPPPVSTRRTEGGYVEWNNLQLSPPPPLYRPFVALDEDKKSNKKLSLKDKFEKRGSQVKLGDSLGKEKTAGVAADEKFARTDEETPKIETVARPGEYVLMVQDVTNPPFLGTRLEPVFLMLKLKRPKKIIVKKPNGEDEGIEMEAEEDSFSD
ncbi:MORN repeat-containing protein 1-like isoform X2 [Littorina saxatilis]|uniref:MORN repeat-containing protein 1-like isoform X2 n=1 Tax=Littorina saxatilis TaxID=31220 RepID=UPI0038B6014E